jgi:hypothetical protein
MEGLKKGMYVGRGHTHTQEGIIIFKILYLFIKVFFIGLFHVSEHVDLFKAIQIFTRKTGNSSVGVSPLVLKKNIFPAFFG